MKISKLFHWLYAILMLLPFAFFVPSVLYYAFNDNATMQSVEVPRTETIVVDFNQLGIGWSNTDFGLTSVFDDTTGQFTINGIGANNGPYLFKYPNQTNTALGWYMKDQHKYFVRSNFNFNDGLRCQVKLGSNYYSPFVNQIFSYNVDESIDHIANVWFYASTGVSVNVENLYVNVFDLTQMFGSGNEPTISEFNNYFPNAYYSYTQSELMQITYDTGETDQFVENTSVINYAWESIWDLPLFSWAKVTFVSVPFAYLTGIFGMGASNSLNYVFGYFATISIVWLVFDLILYVPMLAHNWIDKARIE